MKHEHKGFESQVSGQSWGTRTIETCRCGAYRTFDVPTSDKPVDLKDYSWSPWRQLESERAG